MSLLSCILRPARLRSLLTFCRSIDYWQNNPPISEEDVDIARRIIRAYHAQKNDRRRPRDVSIGRWNKRLETRSKYVDFLENSEPFGLAYFLRTFHRTPATAGIVETRHGFNLSRWGLRGNAGVVNEAYQCLQGIRAVERSSPIKLEHLHHPVDVGNPYIVRIGGQSVHSDSLHSLNHVYAIMNLTDIPRDSENVFVEIGPGVGLTASHMLKIYPNSKIIMVDIPEILVISAYLMAKVFPDRKIAFFEDVADLGRALSDYDIIFIPHWFADHIPDRTVDLFVNTTSMTDMPLDEAKRYLAIIERALKPNGFFYSYNNMAGTGPEFIDPDGSGFGMNGILDTVNFRSRFEAREFDKFWVMPFAKSRAVVFRHLHPNPGPEVRHPE